MKFVDRLTAWDFAEQRRINRLLRWAPRLSVRGRVRLAITRRLFGIAAIGSARRVSARRLGIELTRLENAEQTRARIIRPLSAPAALVVDFHGGAWAVGLAAMDDRLNAGIAKHCRMAVAAIDYRLALPRTIGEVRAECVSSTRALLRLPEFQGLPVFFTGESAGGHLALCVAQELRDAPELCARFAGLVLNYGAYDLAGTPSALRADSSTLVLHGPTLRQQIDLLCRDVPSPSRRDPVLSPLYGPMEGLPPTLIVVGTLDPLIDDSTQLASKLRSAGVAAELQVMPDAPHGVLHLGGSYAAKVRQFERDWYAGRMRQIGSA